MTRSTASRRARNSASVSIGGRRVPCSRPSRRRWRLASSRVEPVRPRTSSSPPPDWSGAGCGPVRRCWAGRRRSARRLTGAAAAAATAAAAGAPTAVALHLVVRCRRRRPRRRRRRARPRSARRSRCPRRRRGGHGHGHGGRGDGGGRQRSWASRPRPVLLVDVLGGERRLVVEDDRVGRVGEQLLGELGLGVVGRAPRRAAARPAPRGGWPGDGGAAGAVTGSGAWNVTIGGSAAARLDRRRSALGLGRLVDRRGGELRRPCCAGGGCAGRRRALGVGPSATSARPRAPRRPARRRLATTARRAGRVARAGGSATSGRLGRGLDGASAGRAAGSGRRVSTTTGCAGCGCRAGRGTAPAGRGGLAVGAVGAAGQRVGRSRRSAPPRGGWPRVGAGAPERS